MKLQQDDFYLLTVPCHTEKLEKKKSLQRILRQACVILDQNWAKIAH